jgi:hypothetical protein
VRTEINEAADLVPGGGFPDVHKMRVAGFEDRVERGEVDGGCIEPALAPFVEEDIGLSRVAARRGACCACSTNRACAGRSYGVQLFVEAEQVPV